MNERKVEIRTIDCQLAVREASENAQGESRTITGRAIIFNAESEVLDDWGQRFREIILPEAVTMDFLNTQDIKMNLLHERELTLARRNKGATNSSLRLSVDDRGVLFEFEAPKCDIGDRALEMVRRGDYSGCSFEFYPEEYDVEENGDDVIIKHRKFRALTALTIGMDPAYKQTSVNARELVAHEEEGQKQEREAAEAEEARKKAEEEAAAAAKAEAEEAAKRAYEYRKRKLSLETNY